MSIFQEHIYLPGFQHAWVVAILNREKLWCGGSIVTTRHILTAAHCMVDVHISELKVALGSNDYTSKSGGVEFRHLEAFELHPAYTFGLAKYDVAILELNRTITFSFNKAPICLPSNASPDLDKWAEYPYTQVLGYASPDANSTHLKSSRITILNHENCAPKHQQALDSAIKTLSDENDRYILTSSVETLIQDDEFSSSLVCGKNPQIETEGTCPGDSGGPLTVLTNNNRFLQVGTVHGSVDDCDNTKFPTVFVNLLDYEVLDFVRRTLFGSYLPKIKGIQCSVQCTY